MLEVIGAGLCNRTKVVFELIGRHAAAVVGDGQRAGITVGFDADFIVAAGEGNCIVGQRAVVELINGVACVGDQLTQKDFLVRVDGVDHHVKQLLRFCPELFLFHIHVFLSFYLFNK